MHEYVDEREADYSGGRTGGCDAPGEAGEEHEEREEVGEGGVRPVPGVFCFY